MTHEKEEPRDIDLGVNKHSRPEIGFNIPGSSLLDVPGALLQLGKIDQEDGLRETRLALRQIDRRGNREEQSYRKENGQKPDGFEQFVDPQDPLRPPQQEGVLFVNGYNGAFAQRMELYRGGIEEVLRIAHLDGQVILGSFVQSGSRSERQGNELVAKAFMPIEKIIQKTEEENPYRRVVSTPKGWSIEINDRRITEELMEEGLAGERLRKAFINRFNTQLKEGLKECVWREKFSSEKDEDFKLKFILDSLSLSMPYLAQRLGSNDFYTAFSIGIPFLIWGAINGLSHRSEARSPFHRHLDHAWDYFIPLIQADKVGRAFAYLSPVIGKGRTLVREVREK